MGVRILHDKHNDMIKLWLCKQTSSLDKLAGLVLMHQVLQVAYWARK